MPKQSIYLGLALDRNSLTWAGYSGAGEPVEVGSSEQNLADWMAEWMRRWPATAAVGLGVNALRESDARALQLVGPWLRACSWNDAVLAGALVGQPGFWMTLGSPLSSLSGKAVVLSRDPRPQTRVAAQSEGGLEWLTDQALGLCEQLPAHSGLRVRRALGRFLEIPREAERTAILRAVEGLAEYPGPEPACLALLTRTARRLTEFLSQALARARLPAPLRGIWNDGPLEGPLWTLLMDHFNKALPEIRWSSPAYPPEVGAVLLLLAEERALERSNLNPLLAEPLQHAPRASFSSDAWRQLARSEPWL